ncbi:MAG: carboxylating nicotinate-nucleotide diphosphorylase [Verrucomicrobia bacterium]|nr:carboxylating nicotinate-nucleotide diphosphorylase [Verrucomicrobiota bacterium]
MNLTQLDPQQVEQAVRTALAEDVGTGDATTLALVPAELQSEAVMAARESLTVCGLAFAVEAYRQLDPTTQVTLCCKDGDTLAKGDPLLKVKGPSRALLTAERVSLNFLQRLSGVATIARRFVDEVAGTKAKILDTRKTLPGWRMFEKYAVASGGATNHRIGLYDMILIKDNHLVALRDAQPNAVAAAVARARAAYPQLKVEVEADNLTQVAQAVEAGADIILLDNMTNEMMREAVRSVQGRALLEASGGVNLKTVRGKAETGVDFISVGALTHSAPSVDIGLDFF